MDRIDRMGLVIGMPRRIVGWDRAVPGEVLGGTRWQWLHGAAATGWPGECRWQRRRRAAATGPQW
ncbi:hypothetical protein GCM10027080_22420 [Pedococcus soli]